MVLFSPLTAFTEKMLDVTTMRHRVIANNIANLNSPGFKRSEVSFKEALDQIQNSEEETTPEITEEMRVPGINEQLLNNLSLDDLYVEGQQYSSDLGVGYSLSNTTFSKSYARAIPGGSEYDPLDPRAEGGKAMSRADFIASVQPKIIQVDDSQRQDGNNINPEIEMADMIKNTSFYNVLVSSISGDFRTLKTIISNR